jgi:hypothetical protein
MGRFDNAPEEMGIGKMMELADKYGHKLTFFVDFTEAEIYGWERMREPVNLILEKGHDIQLHIHPEAMPKEWFAERGSSPTLCTYLSQEIADEVFRLSIDLARQLGVAQPLIAFRGGGWRWNKNVHHAMLKLNIPYSYNYNVGARDLHTRQPLPFIPPDSSYAYPYNQLPPFYWENSLHEVPTGVYQNGTKVNQFENYVFAESIRTIEKILENSFAAMNGQSNVLVIVMHSWSLLYLEDQYFVYKDRKLADDLEKFFKMIAENDEYKIITATDYDRLLKKGKIHHLPETIKITYKCHPQKAEFKDLQVGHRVKVIGRQMEWGAFEAFEIRLETSDNAPAQEVTIAGSIRRIDHEKNAIHILGREFALPYGIAVKDLQFNSIGLEGLKAGDRVKLKGRYAERMGFTPIRIKMKNPKSADIDEMQGTIGKIDRAKQTFDLAGFTVRVDAKATKFVLTLFCEDDKS